MTITDAHDKDSTPVKIGSGTVDIYDACGKKIFTVSLSGLVLQVKAVGEHTAYGHDGLYTYGEELLIRPRSPNCVEIARELVG